MKLPIIKLQMACARADLQEKAWVNVFDDDFIQEDNYPQN